MVAGTLDFDFALGEAADTIRALAADYSRKRIAPLAAGIDESNEFPRQLWPELGSSACRDHGRGAVGRPRSRLSGASCGDGGDLPRFRVGRTLLRCACEPLVNQIRRWADDAQKERFLPKLISGEHVGALAMSEAEAGSDVMWMRLRAESVEGGYRLTGTKFWITNGPHADVVVVYAVTDAAAGPRGITAFLVEKGRPGFSVSPKLHKMGMRGSDTAELVFDGCLVPAENVLGAVGNGSKILMSGLDYERAVLAGGPLGIMRGALDVVLPYVRDRQQFGVPIGSFQLVQAKVADMYVALNSARAYVYAVALACDAGRTTRFDAAGAILLASENAVRSTLEAIQALGGAGYTTEWPVERLLRDAKLYDIGAGTNEIRRYLIGRELIGF